MENCSVCNRNSDICDCHSDAGNTELELLIAVLDVMSWKVKLYKEMTQNRLLMIKEDIMASVNEEITKYHLFLMRSMTVLEGFIENLQISDEGELPEEVMNIIPSIKPNRFNLNSSQIQEDFSRALAGEYVYFRETLRKQANS